MSSRSASSNGRSESPSPEGAPASSEPPLSTSATRRERTVLLNKRLALLLAEMDTMNDDDYDDDDDDEDGVLEADSHFDSASQVGRNSAALNLTDLDDWGDEREEEGVDDDLVSCSSVARSMVANFSTVANGMVHDGEDNEVGTADHQVEGDQSSLRAIQLIQRFMLRHVLPNCRAVSIPTPLSATLTAPAHVGDDNDGSVARDDDDACFPQKGSSEHINRGDGAHTSTTSEREIPEPVLNALRILQNRFRFARLRRQVDERDRDQAIRRLQELWRRRREVNLHFQAMRRGKEHAAARDIQTAFRAAMSRRQQITSPVNEGGLPAANHHSHQSSSSTHAVRQQRGSDTSNDLPLCIICMSNPVGIALLPCGHAHVCGECGQHLRRCPTCRRRIALQIRIYL